MIRRVLLLPPRLMFAVGCVVVIVAAGLLLAPFRLGERDR